LVYGNHITDYAALFGQALSILSPRLSLPQASEHPDGGFVMLGKGKEDTDGDISSTDFLLKVDEKGNEEWYQTYFPPEADYHTESVYDLEMTPDGGMAFVGNYFSYDSENFVTWIVKPDACGELVFNRCGPQVVVEKVIDNDSSLRVYPNPAEESVQVNCRNEAAFLELYNAVGQLE